MSTSVGGSLAHPWNCRLPGGPGRPLSLTPHASRLTPHSHPHSSHSPPSPPNPPCRLVQLTTDHLRSSAKPRRRPNNIFRSKRLLVLLLSPLPSCRLPATARLRSLHPSPSPPYSSHLISSSSSLPYRNLSLPLSPLPYSSPPLSPSPTPLLHLLLLAEDSSFPSTLGTRDRLSNPRLIGVSLIEPSDRRQHFSPLIATQRAASASAVTTLLRLASASASRSSSPAVLTWGVGAYCFETVSLRVVTAVVLTQKPF